MGREVQTHCRVESDMHIFRVLQVVLRYHIVFSFTHMSKSAAMMYKRSPRSHPCCMPLTDSCLVPVDITTLPTMYVVVDISIDIDHLVACVELNVE